MPNTKAEHTRGVVLLMTDTTRWDMLSCYADTGVLTPCLDRLARGGIRFNRAYTCQPVCAPARSALFTGTWPHSNGVWANNLPLGQNVPTVGQRLSDAGVHTAYIGKWHLDGTDYFGNGRCPDGWDAGYWFDQRRYLDELPVEERPRSRDVHANDQDMQDEFTYAYRCSDRAVDFLRHHGDESFFLAVSYDEPHGPSLSPAAYHEQYLDHEFPRSPNVWDTLGDKPAHQRTWAGDRRYADRDAVRIREPHFFGAQSFADSQIGRVIEAIDRFAPDALVIYTSDHGDALESHCLSGKGPAAYDEIARVPFLVRWPGVAPADAWCAHPVSHIDVVPTILDAMGFEAPPFLEGASLVGTFRDPAHRPSAYVFCEFGRYEVDHDGFGGFQPMRAVLDGNHKLVVNLLSDDELYDLTDDPGETVNLISRPDYARARDRLHDRLLTWMHDTRDPFRGYQWARRPWRTDAAQPTWAGRGMTRQRRDDLYQPRMLDYDTGLEMTDSVRKKTMPQQPD